MSVDEVQVDVYDSAFAWVGQVAEYDELTATRRHLALSTADFAVPSDSDLTNSLGAATAHVVVSYKGEQFVPGMVFARDGGVLTQESRRYTVHGYWDVLASILGWPVPGAALTGQTVAYWEYATGPAPAETVLKALVSANLTRLGLSWLTVATDQGRGSNIDPSLRFHPLTDRLLPGLAASGIGVTFTLVEGEGIVLDVYEQTTHALPLTVASGVIVDGPWRVTRPTASRAVAGSQGQEESRVFFGPMVDVAREATYGFCGEIFVDARDTDDPTTVDARMAEALAEAGQKVSVSLELAETEDFTYPEVFEVGDVVPLELADDVSATDVVDAVTLRVSSADGLLVTPHVGDLPDEGDELDLVVGHLAAQVRDEKVR